MNTWMYAAISLFGIFISAISQVLLKKSSMKAYEHPVQEYLNPLVITAYAIFVASTLLGILAYRGLPLSMGSVLGASSYLFVTFFGVTVFHEHLGRRKAAALLLIIAGIIVAAVWG